MVVMIESNPRPARCHGSGGMGQVGAGSICAKLVVALVAVGRKPALVGTLLGVFLFFLMLTGRSAWAAGSGFEVPIKPIAQITFDDDGLPMGYPIATFYDPVEDEIYVVNGRTNRVVVYGPDFFPRESIGVGRGVIAPRGGIVMSNGEVYICQIKDFRNPSPRITILNGAFFIDREIALDQIPEAKGLTPRQVAVSNQGNIYLAGYSHRGVLVLDPEGNFLHQIQPMDEIPAYALDELAAQETAENGDVQEDQGEEVEPIIAEDGVTEQPKDDALIDIPEEFRPRTSKSGRPTGAGKGLGPVKVNYVTFDGSGRLYLLSDEIGKIYVYGPDEALLFSFGLKGGSPGQLSQPRGLVVDDNRGLIYVVDYMRHTIVTYDLTGKFLFEVGGRGFEPGWFNFPTAIALDNQGQLIVADLFNKRVQVIEVEFEKALKYKDKLEKAAASGTRDGGASTGQDAAAPGQPESAQEAPAAQSDVVIEETVIPDENLNVQPDGASEQKETPDAGGLAGQDAAAPGQPESAQEAPAAQSDGVIEETIIPDENLPVQPDGAAEKKETPETTPGAQDSGGHR
jgi:DNA-binding beta-propeller fold protein YncE